MTPPSSSPLLPPGVTLLERGWLSSNTIVLQGGGSTVVIDSGYGAHAGQTVALLAAATGEAGVDVLISTHLHSDHCGGNAAIQARWPGVQTWIPPGQADHVRNWDPVALSYAPTGQWCPRFRFEDVLSPGSDVELAGRRWQVHAAPGHDPHSIVLFEPVSRVLVSADALWERGFGVVFPELEGLDAFDQVAATLDLIEGLRPAVVLPGHGAAFTDLAASLHAARSKLAAFRADPSRHAAHASKVLIKFKLLEWQSIPRGSLLEWCEAMGYLRIVHDRWFSRLGLAAWIETLVADLVRGGAVRWNGDVLVNA